MHPNYEYILNFIQSHLPTGTRTLDYGCGAAEMIRTARAEGLNVFGADSFYKGGDTRTDVTKLGYLDCIVKEIRNDRIDFPDCYFDIVVNNQVLEHVEHLDAVLQEIHRVLKFGGKVLSLFPTREVWSEGHCGVPFLHRFRKGSKLRLYYALAWRLLGKGYYKGAKTRMEWSRDFCEWLDLFTFYRTKKEITLTFERHFRQLDFIEVDYLLFRMARLSPLSAKVFSRASQIHIFNALLCAFVNKKAGMVLVATKQ